MHFHILTLIPINGNIDLFAKQELLQKEAHYMTTKSFINKTVTLRVNHPLGSKHPVYDFFYPINSGYIPIDSGKKKLHAYVLGIYEPLEIFEGTCIAILHHLRDKNDTLIIVPDGKNYTDAEISALTEFQEKFFEQDIIR